MLDPLPPVRAHRLLAYTPLRPSTSVRILFFKEYMTDIFCELLSTKEPQPTLQNKEPTVESYRKMLNQNSKKSLAIELALFNCTR